MLLAAQKLETKRRITRSLDDLEPREEWGQGKPQCNL